MSKRIVVALKRHDRIEEILRCIETVARPGMRVVFLLPYPVESGAYLSDHWIDTESPTKAMLAGREINYRYSSEMQRGLAERKIAPARDSLSKMQVEVAVHVYTGSLRKLLAAYAVKEETHLMMVSRGVWPWRRIAAKIPLLHRLKRPRFHPIIWIWTAGLELR